MFFKIFFKDLKRDLLMKSRGILRSSCQGIHDKTRGFQENSHKNHKKIVGQFLKTNRCYQ